MTEFISFNWMLFKALGLLTMNIWMLLLLVSLFMVIMGNIFRGGGDD